MMRGGAVLTVEDVKDPKRLDILLDLTTSQSVPHPPNHFQIHGTLGGTASRPATNEAPAIL